MSGGEKASPDVNDMFGPDGPLDPSRALIPAVVRLNEQRVLRGFWPKMRRVAAHIPFAAEALSLWFCARDDETPAQAKALVLAGLAYFVLPTDAIPDWIPLLGFGDDAAVIAAVMSAIGRNLKPRHREAAKVAVDRLREEG